MSFGDTSDDNSSGQVPTVKKPKKDSKKHKCPEPGCDATFSRPYRLKNHIASRHRNEKPFSCDYQNCNKSYTNQSHLDRHVAISHLEEGQFQSVICGVENCGMVYSNKYNLKKHIFSQHQDLPFKCHLCPKKFHRKSQLNQHKIEIHHEAAPYKCNKCPNTFVQYHLYQKHIKRHKTYTCDCDQLFNRWTEYLKHKRTECTIPKQIYKCAICDKTFAWKPNLTQHCSKVHLPNSQNDNFRCPYLDCRYSYKYKHNLQFHIKTFHEKIFEYFECTKKACKAVLKSKQNLKQHLRLCHSDKPLKEKTRRKLRKDKGIKGKGKKSTASVLSGVRVGHAENKDNIAGTST